MVTHGTAAAEMDSSVSIRIDEIQKHSSRGKSLEILKLQAFTQDKGVSVITVLKEYLLRGDFLFSSYLPPHHKVSVPTIGRWVRMTLALAGIETNIFKTHSTQCATFSAMACAGTPIQEILRKGSWSDETTFRQFYLRTLP